MSDKIREPDELSPREREAFDALPREKDPGDLLEERVVRSLKERGLLRSSAPVRTASRPVRWTPGWMVGAAAAALVLFLSGLAVGQWMSTRSALGAFLALQERDEALAADRVQAAGSEYVRVLARFAEGSPEGSAEELAQGREAALGALLAATEILTRLESGDPDLGALLRYLEERRTGSPTDTSETRNIYWF